MEYQVFLIVIFAIVIVAVVWYLSRGLFTIDDDDLLDVSTKENQLLEKWISDNRKIRNNFEINNQEIARKALKKLFNIDHLDGDDELIIIDAINAKQKEICKEIYDLRRILGLNLLIAQIPARKTAAFMNVNADPNEIIKLDDILESDLEVPIKEFISQLLSERWKLVTDLAGSELLNGEDSLSSFVYLKNWDIPLVKTEFAPNKYRVNLLCGELEFKTLINRWSSKRKKKTFNFDI